MHRFVLAMNHLRWSALSSTRWSTLRIGGQKRLGDKPLHLRPVIRFGVLVGVFLLAGLRMLPAASVQEEVRAADTARVMATIAGNVDRLAPLLSDHLAYGHADGRVQDKAELLAAVGSSRMKYEAYDYEELQITPLDDNVVTLSGRARLRARIGPQLVAFRLRFLAVWRREDGAWRLFAYQSAQLPAPGK